MAFGRSEPTTVSVAVAMSIVVAFIALLVQWLVGAGVWVYGEAGGLTMLREDAPAYVRVLRIAGHWGFVFGGIAAVLVYGTRTVPLVPRMLIFCAVVWSCGWMGLLMSQGMPLVSALDVTQMNPNYLFACLGIFAARDPHVWKWLPGVARVIAVMAAGSVVYEIPQIPESVNRLGNAPIVNNLQPAIWFGAYGLLCAPRGRLVYAVINVSCLVIAASGAFTAGNRSWWMLVLLVLLLWPFRLLSGQHRRKHALAMVGVAVIVGSAAAGAVALQRVRPDAFAYTFGRLTQDSRTGQYYLLFSQVPWQGMLLGYGPSSSYAHPHYGEEYRYFDNCYLYTVWKYGVPAVLGYLACTFGSGLFFLSRSPRGETLGMVMLLCLWLLAGMGLSIFHNIYGSAQSMLIILLSGRLYMLTSIRPLPPQHQLVRRI